MKDFPDHVKDSAIETAQNFMDEILEKLIEGSDASDDLLNDYPNGGSYHHENHVDIYYSPTEAIELLEELDDYEETDSGLWEGVGDWRKLIGTIAAYTHGNAVYAAFRELIQEINSGYQEVLDKVVEEFRDDAKKKLAEDRTEENRNNVDEGDDFDTVTADEIDDDDADEEIDSVKLDSAKKDRLTEYLKEVFQDF